MVRAARAEVAQGAARSRDSRCRRRTSRPWRPVHSVNNMANEAINVFGTIDILINNAGTRHINNILDHTKQQWDDMLSVNLTGPYLCCKAVIPHMIKGGKGKIINFGSIASFMGRPDRVAYVAAKTGVLTIFCIFLGNSSKGSSREKLN